MSSQEKETHHEKELHRKNTLEKMDKQADGKTGSHAEGKIAAHTDMKNIIETSGKPGSNSKESAVDGKESDDRRP